jgi:hypothetical protein
MERYKKNLLRFWLTIALVVVYSVKLAAQSEPDESQLNRTTGINGTVVTDTGQPLAGALVSIRAYGEAGLGRSLTTDAEGSFRVSGLEALTYMVFASFPAYVLAPRDPDSTQAPYYRVGDSVRIQLIKGGVITGSVTTAAGEPVIAVRVQASMIRDANGKPLRYGASFRQQVTDDRGIYRIYGLSPGAYVVSAGGAGSYMGDNSSPYETDTPTFAPSSTRDTATEVSVQPGGEASNIDIRYRGEPGHIVSGNAIDPVAQTTPSGFTIFMTPIASGRSQWTNTSYQQPGSSGFSFYGVADGDYDLMAQTYFPTGEVAISDPRRVKVSGSNITGVELTVKPLGSITGHLVLEDSKAPECKGKRKPLFGETLITPWHNEKNTTKDQPQFPWSYGSPVLPDKQGDFTLRNLAPGQYRFHTRPFAKYWYLQSILLRPSVAASAKTATANRSVDAARNWTTVNSGARVSGLFITLAEGAASVKGQIRLAEGQKMPPKLFIYLIPAEPEKADDILRYFASLVETDGNFALNNLPPGRYWALAKAAAENESAVLSKLRLPDEAEYRTKLRQEAELAKTEAELKPCQNLTDYQLPLKLR